MYPSLLAPDRPDWRWARVAELSQYSNTQAAARLESQDEIVRSCFEFKRSLDRGMPIDNEVFAAHTVYLNQPQLRYLIEGLLLGDADNAHITQNTGVPDIVVQSYHDIFYSVRPFLKSPLWITSNIFNNDAHLAHKGDRPGIKLRLGWLCGWEVFTALQEVRLSAAHRAALRERIKDVFHAHMAEFAINAPYHFEATPEWLKIIMGEDASGAGGSGDYEDCLTSFLDGLGITVADGTDKRNLSLPAREPRTVPYEVVNNV